MNPIYGPDGELLGAEFDIIGDDGTVIAASDDGDAFDSSGGGDDDGLGYGRTYTALGADHAPPPLTDCLSVVRQATRHRALAPSVDVVGEDSAHASNCLAGFSLSVPEPSRVEVFGDLFNTEGATASAFPTPPAPPAPYTGGGSFPLLTRIYRRFAGVEPEPKRARLDDEATYTAFSSARADAQLQRLAEVLADHLADGHGGGDPAMVVRIAREVSRRRVPGPPISLPLPAFAKGKIRCWQDGPEICCSIRFLDLDGARRVITTGTSVSDSIEDVLGYVDDAGLDPRAMVSAIPALAQVLGGDDLVPQLAAAAIPLSQMAAGRTPYIGRIVSAGDPALAATMVLLQAAQRGDRQARSEANRLLEHARGDTGVAAMVAEGSSRLALAQATKTEAGT